MSVSYLKPEVVTYTPAGGVGISNGTGPRPRAYSSIVVSCDTAAKVVFYDDEQVSGAAAPLDPAATPFMTVQLQDGESFSPCLAGRALRTLKGLFYIVLTGTNVHVNFDGV